MNSNTKLAIGAGVGLAALVSVVYIASVMPSPLPQAPKPPPLPPKPGPQPPQPPPPPPPLDPNAVAPGTTFEATLQLTPDANTTPAAEVDATDILGLANMVVQVIQSTSDPTQWTIVVLYNGSKTIKITGSAHFRTGDGRGYTASLLNPFTVGGTV